MGKYVCDLCGWEYDPEAGYPEAGIAPGTAWEDVPEYETLISQDIEQAKYWWKKAAAQGNENAKNALQPIYN